jgi:hypothetical protein
MRISPNEVSFNDIEASETIYAQTSKFDKSRYFYRAIENPGRICSHCVGGKGIRRTRNFLVCNVSRQYHLARVIDVRQGHLFDGTVCAAREKWTDDPTFPYLPVHDVRYHFRFCVWEPSRALHLEDFQSHTFEAIEKGNSTVLHVRALHTLPKSVHDISS